MNLNVNLGTGIRGAFNAAMAFVLYLFGVRVVGRLICFLVGAHGDTATGNIHLLVFMVSPFAFLVIFAVSGVRSKAKHKAKILRVLHESVPAGFEITDEHFGTDEEAAIALDRDSGRFLLWQKQTSRVQVYPVEAIKAIEYCETGSPKKLQLRLELTDINNPNVSLCFGLWSSRSKTDRRASRPTLELKAKSLDWKALLEARYEGMHEFKGD